MLTKDHHCLETIIEASDRIIEYTSGFNSADEFNNDYRNFDATMMNFVVIGEMVDKISDEFKKALRLARSAARTASESALKVYERKICPVYKLLCTTTVSKVYVGCGPTHVVSWFLHPGRFILTR